MPKLRGRTNDFSSLALLFLGSSFVFVAYLIRFGYGVLLPRIIEDLGLSHVEAGLAYSLFLLLYSVFSVISGRLFDMFGIKVISLLCCVYGVGAVLVGLSYNYYMLVLSLALAGLGSSCSWAPMVALVSSRLPNHWRGRAIGILEVGIRISHGAVGLILPFLVLTSGWRASWWIIAALLLAYGVSFRMLSGFLGAERRREEPFKYREVLSSKQFWLVGSSYFLMAFGSYIIITFLVDFLENEIRLPYVEASAMVSIMGFMGIFGTLMLTWLSDRVGRETIIAVCNVLSSVSLLFLSLSLQNITIKSLLMPLTAIYGIFYGGLWPTYAACAGDVFPNAVGTVVGLWTLMCGMSALLAPITGGLIVDLTGSYIMAFQLSFVTYALAAALIISALMLKQPRFSLFSSRRLAYI